MNMERNDSMTSKNSCDCRHGLPTPSTRSTKRLFDPDCLPEVSPAGSCRFLGTNIAFNGSFAFGTFGCRGRVPPLLGPALGGCSYVELVADGTRGRDSAKGALVVTSAWLLVSKFLGPSLRCSLMTLRSRLVLAGSSFGGSLVML